MLAVGSDRLRQHSAEVGARHSLARCAWLDFLILRLNAGPIPHNAMPSRASEPGHVEATP
jgi:hypothetical protein